MRTAWTIAVMRLVLQRSFRRRRQSFREAMVCSPRQRILACVLLCRRCQRPLAGQP